MDDATENVSMQSHKLFRPSILSELSVVADELVFMPFRFKMTPVYFKSRGMSSPDKSKSPEGSFSNHSHRTGFIPLGCFKNL
jgi:hypothetical protein